MTENEVMTLDEAIAHAREVAEDKRADCIACAEEHEQLAKWLEELRLYRVIGTPERILARFNDGAVTLEQSKVVIEATMRKIEEYEEIGTVEELQALKEKNADCIVKHLTGFCSYEETGCSDCRGKEEIKNAMEKQRAKTLTFYGDSEDGKLLCPACEEDLWEIKECGFSNCPYCGQKLNWGDEE